MDFSEYIDTFRDEVREYSDKAILVMDNEIKEEDIETIRRAAHTIKSSSKLMGFEALSDLCLKTEAVLIQGIDKVREKEEIIKKAFSIIKEVGMSVSKPGEDVIDPGLIAELER